MDCNLPGSSVHGNFQIRILKWLATPFSRGSSQLRDQMESPIISNILPRRASLYRSQLEIMNYTCWTHLPLHIPHVPQVAWSAHPQSWRMCVCVLELGTEGLSAQLHKGLCSISGHRQIFFHSKWMILIWGHYGLVIHTREQPRWTTHDSTSHTSEVEKGSVALAQGSRFLTFSFPVLPTNSVV